jgi:hypothetical protein
VLVVTLHNILYATYAIDSKHFLGSCKTEKKHFQAECLYYEVMSSPEGMW